MELKDLEQRFENPIPGMALTHEVGARPWQSPAQYTKMEDVIDYYVSRTYIILTRRLHITRTS